ncbi:MAG TPA: DUF3037 domain-containing protein [Terriglobales bacterium]|nr:DUF3037 domain-containing protein [Terriglobales bacterium]
MSKKYQLELRFLRYVPNVVRRASVEIGVVLINRNRELAGFRFTNDWRSAKCLLADSDLEALEMLGRHLEQELVAVSGLKEFQRVFEYYVTSGLELSSPIAVETDDPVKELDVIARLYLEAPRVKGPPRATGRNMIVASVTSAFEEKGVLKLLQHNIQVAPYTLPNDRYTIDYLYQWRRTVKMFQAVSVARDETQAVALAIRQADMKAGLGRENKELLLTAVIEDNMDHVINDAYALHALERAEIHVVRVSEMPSLAEIARVELGA